MSSPSKSPDRIAGMFDAIAGKYDFLNHFLSVGIDRRWRKRAIRSLQLTGRERILDLCTGTGDLAIGARTAVPPASRVVGVDFAGEMLRVGHAKLHRLRLIPSIALVRGDAEHLPIADRSVDAVTIGFGIRNVEHMQAACDEIYRVLMPGGRVAILEFAVPTMPGVRGAYLWYFRNILPRLGRAISRHPGAYDYLPASVSAFETPDEFVTILRRSGFVEIRAVPMTFGTVFLYTGRRHA
jgi:demethylmenaquinone methyltransferase/2-methoxy-6-polyprenyl-1,4-benzoquinol methylase